MDVACGKSVVVKAMQYYERMRRNIHFHWRFNDMTAWENSWNIEREQKTDKKQNHGYLDTS